MWKMGEVLTFNIVTINVCIISWNKMNILVKQSLFSNTFIYIITTSIIIIYKIDNNVSNVFIETLLNTTEH